MKKYLQFTLLLAGLYLGLIPHTKAQGILGIAGNQIDGLPQTVSFGDTIQNLGVWLKNQGNQPVGGSIVSFWGATTQQQNPFAFGTLDLTLGILLPGDSTYVPLDYFVVSPQNSNAGSNVMVIWPTAPGTQPGDSASGPYEVDGPTAVAEHMDNGIQLGPNPMREVLEVKLDGHGQAVVQIIDSKGNLIMEAAAYNDLISFNVEDLEPGIYFCRIQGRSKYATKKLLKL